MRVLDLRFMNPDGRTREFTRARDRERVRDMQRLEKPEWLVGAPPCGPCSIWHFNFNCRKMDPERVKRNMEAGMIDLRFVCGLYQAHVEHGNGFLHEHHTSAKSWRMRCVQRILDLPGVGICKADQCMHGPTTTGPDGTQMPCKKPTAFMTNSGPMRRRLAQRCPGIH